MVKKVFDQLESLARKFQVGRLKRNYPQLTGIRIARGRLWQHPGNFRQEVLNGYRQRLSPFGLSLGEF